MIRYLLISGVLLLSASFAARAQTIGEVHVTTGISTSENSVNSSTTLGGGIGFDHYFASWFSTGLEFNYLGFVFDTADVSVTIMPIQLRLAGYVPVTENFDVYAGTGAGIFVQRFKTTQASLNQETLWGLTPRLGLIYEFAENVYLDFNANYAYILSESEIDDVSGIISINLGLGYNIAADF